MGNEEKSSIIPGELADHIVIPCHISTDRNYSLLPLSMTNCIITVAILTQITVRRRRGFARLNLHSLASCSKRLQKIM